MRRTLVGTEDASVRVLIINEDQRTVESIQDALIGTTIAVAHVTGSGQGGIDFLESDGAEVVVFRIPLHDWSPLDFVGEVMQRWPESRVIASGGLIDYDLIRTGVRDWIADGDWRMYELIDAIRRAGNR